MTSDETQINSNRCRDKETADKQKLSRRTGFGFADETQKGPSSCPRLQFLAFSFDSIMSLPR